MPEHDSSLGFLPDGHERARKAIREDVIRRLARALKRPVDWIRKYCREEVGQEVERRVEYEAPPDALY